MRISKLPIILSGIFHHVRSSFYNGPSYLIIFFTGRCNLKCDHCLYYDNLNQVLAQNEFTLPDYEKTSCAKCPRKCFQKDQMDKIKKLMALEIILRLKTTHESSPNYEPLGILAKRVIHKEYDFDFSKYAED